ncbi:hypothetical protein BRD22_10440 [Halobacteriales archaeon SW_8_68_21]|nr:MAG: hypothetical protein BRD22_10440 [Halobacteriales archaeon SW_8_68_21]
MSLRDESRLTPRRATLLTYAFLGLFALLSAGSLVVADSPPWGVAAVAAAVTAVLAGPVAWLVRDRLPAERRTTLGRVVVVVASLGLTVSFGVALAFEVSFLSVTDAVTVGVVCGGAVALLVERTVVPERYRADWA